ncbi:hypothetical protein [Blastopirellula marina]|uniref:Uncharacterized protein n=1 Tax=Blastopirellula marina DSM 3645 TaxID=314230 RepID=A3ZMM3_9BACT|nr:hypothetical protein [Blastopirellula marina]EAQ82196.1 hypothetical protein DSM3645_00740 [Blastopirellula marina DSM 3645]
MFEITTRPLNESEREKLQRKSQVRRSLFLVVMAILTLLGGGFLSALWYGIGQRIGPGWALIGLGAGWIQACLLATLASRAYFAERSARIASFLGDLQHGQVEEIQVMEADVVEIGMTGFDEPALLFAIDEGQLLLLQGLWLFGGNTYGVDLDWSLQGGAAEVFNGLPAPNSFPSSVFVVTRYPLSGDVISIRVEGEYRTPRIENVKYAEKHCTALRDCEILSGTLETLEQSLTAAYDGARKAE